MENNQLFQDAASTVADYLHSAQGYRRNLRKELVERVTGYTAAADCSVDLASFQALQLAQLEELTFLREAVEEVVRAQVMALRDGGASWANIGQYLGISKQAAQQKYGK